MSDKHRRQRSLPGSSTRRARNEDREHSRYSGESGEGGRTPRGRSSGDQRRGRSSGDQWHRHRDIPSSSNARLSPSTTPGSSPSADARNYQESSSTLEKGSGDGNVPLYSLAAQFDKLKESINNITAEAKRTKVQVGKSTPCRQHAGGNEAREAQRSLSHRRSRGGNRQQEVLAVDEEVSFNLTPKASLKVRKIWPVTQPDQHTATSSQRQYGMTVPPGASLHRITEQRFSSFRERTGRTKSSPSTGWPRSHATGEHSTREEDRREGRSMHRMQSAERREKHHNRSSSHSKGRAETGGLKSSSESRLPNDSKTSLLSSDSRHTRSRSPRRADAHDHDRPMSGPGQSSKEEPARNDTGENQSKFQIVTIGSGSANTSVKEPSLTFPRGKYARLAFEERIGQRPHSLQDPPSNHDKKSSNRVQPRTVTDQDEDQRSAASTSWKTHIKGEWKVISLYEEPDKRAASKTKRAEERHEKRSGNATVSARSSDVPTLLKPKPSKARHSGDKKSTADEKNLFDMFKMSSNKDPSSQTLSSERTAEKHRGRPPNRTSRAAGRSLSSKVHSPGRVRNEDLGTEPASAEERSKGPAHDSAPVDISDGENIFDKMAEVQKMPSKALKPGGAKRLTRGEQGDGRRDNKMRDCVVNLGTPKNVDEIGLRNITSASLLKVGGNDVTSRESSDGENIFETMTKLSEDLKPEAGAGIPDQSSPGREYEGSTEQRVEVDTEQASKENKKNETARGVPSFNAQQHLEQSSDKSHVCSLDIAQDISSTDSDGENIFDKMANVHRGSNRIESKLTLTKKPENKPTTKETSTSKACIPVDETSEVLPKEKPLLDVCNNMDQLSPKEFLGEEGRGSVTSLEPQTQSQVVYTSLRRVTRSEKQQILIDDNVTSFLADDGGLKDGDGSNGSSLGELDGRGASDSSRMDTKVTGTSVGTVKAVSPIGPRTRRQSMSPKEGENTGKRKDGGLTGTNETPKDDIIEGKLRDRSAISPKGPTAVISKEVSSRGGRTRRKSTSPKEGGNTGERKRDGLSGTTETPNKGSGNYGGKPTTSAITPKVPTLGGGRKTRNSAVPSEEGKSSEGKHDDGPAEAVEAPKSVVSGTRGKPTDTSVKDAGPGSNLRTKKGTATPRQEGNSGEHKRQAGSTKYVKTTGSDFGGSKDEVADTPVIDAGPESNHKTKKGTATSRGEENSGEHSQQDGCTKSVRTTGSDPSGTEGKVADTPTVMIAGPGGTRRTKRGTAISGEKGNQGEQAGSTKSVKTAGRDPSGTDGKVAEKSPTAGSGHRTRRQTSPPKKNITQSGDAVAGSGLSGEVIDATAMDGSGDASEAAEEPDIASSRSERKTTDITARDAKDHAAGSRHGMEEHSTMPKGGDILQQGQDEGVTEAAEEHRGDSSGFESDIVGEAIAEFFENTASDMSLAFSSSSNEDDQDREISDMINGLLHSGTGEDDRDAPASPDEKDQGTHQSINWNNLAVSHDGVRSDTIRDHGDLTKTMEDAPTTEDTLIGGISKGGPQQLNTSNVDAEDSGKSIQDDEAVPVCDLGKGQMDVDETKPAGSDNQDDATAEQVAVDKEEFDESTSAKLVKDEKERSIAAEGEGCVENMNEKSNLSDVSDGLLLDPDEKAGISGMVDDCDEKSIKHDKIGHPDLSGVPTSGQEEQADEASNIFLILKEKSKDDDDGLSDNKNGATGEETAATGEENIQNESCSDTVSESVCQKASPNLADESSNIFTLLEEHDPKGIDGAPEQVTERFRGPPGQEEIGEQTTGHRDMIEKEDPLSLNNNRCATDQRDQENTATNQEQSRSCGLADLDWSSNIFTIFGDCKLGVEPVSPSGSCQRDGSIRPGKSNFLPPVKHLDVADGEDACSEINIVLKGSAVSSPSQELTGQTMANVTGEENHAVEDGNCLKDQQEQRSNAMTEDKPTPCVLDVDEGKNIFTIFSDEKSKKAELALPHGSQQLDTERMGDKQTDQSGLPQESGQNDKRTGDIRKAKSLPPEDNGGSCSVFPSPLKEYDVDSDIEDSCSKQMSTVVEVVIDCSTLGPDLTSEVRAPQGEISKDDCSKAAIGTEGEGKNIFAIFDHDYHRGGSFSSTSDQSREGQEKAVDRSHSSTFENVDTGSSQDSTVRTSSEDSLGGENSDNRESTKVGTTREKMISGGDGTTVPSGVGMNTSVSSGIDVPEEIGDSNDEQQGRQKPEGNSYLSVQIKKLDVSSTGSIAVSLDGTLAMTDESPTGPPDDPHPVPSAEDMQPSTNSAESPRGGVPGGDGGGLKESAVESEPADAITSGGDGEPLLKGSADKPESELFKLPLGSSLRGKLSEEEPPMLDRFDKNNPRREYNSSSSDECSMPVIVCVESVSSKHGKTGVGHELPETEAGSRSPVTKALHQEGKECAIGSSSSQMSNDKGQNFASSAAPTSDSREVCSTATCSSSAMGRNSDMKGDSVELSTSTAASLPEQVDLPTGSLVTSTSAGSLHEPMAISTCSLVSSPDTVKNTPSTEVESGVDKDVDTIDGFTFVSFGSKEDLVAYSSSNRKNKNKKKPASVLGISWSTSRKKKPPKKSPPKPQSIFPGALKEQSERLIEKYEEQFRKDLDKRKRREVLHPALLRRGVSIKRSLDFGIPLLLDLELLDVDLERKEKHAKKKKKSKKFKKSKSARSTPSPVEMLAGSPPAAVAGTPLHEAVAPSMDLATGDGGARWTELTKSLKATSSDVASAVQGGMVEGSSGSRYSGGKVGENASQKGPGTAGDGLNEMQKTKDKKDEELQEILAGEHAIFKPFEKPVLNQASAFFSPELDTYLHKEVGREQSAPSMSSKEQKKKPALSRHRDKLNSAIQGISFSSLFKAKPKPDSLSAPGGRKSNSAETSSHKNVPSSQSSLVGISYGSTRVGRTILKKSSPRKARSKYGKCPPISQSSTKMATSTQNKSSQYLDRIVKNVRKVTDSQPDPGIRKANFESMGKGASGGSEPETSRNDYTSIKIVQNRIVHVGEKMQTRVSSAGFLPVRDPTSPSFKPHMTRTPESINTRKMTKNRRKQLMEVESSPPEHPMPRDYSNIPGGPSPCGNDYCRLGCVCESLGRVVDETDVQHCRKVECMFECSCERFPSLRILRSRKRPAIFSEAGMVFYDGAGLLSDRNDSKKRKFYPAEEERPPKPLTKAPGKVPSQPPSTAVTQKPTSKSSAGSSKDATKSVPKPVRKDLGFARGRIYVAKHVRYALKMEEMRSGTKREADLMDSADGSEGIPPLKVVRTTEGYTLHPSAKPKDVVDDENEEDIGFKLLKKVDKMLVQSHRYRLKKSKEAEESRILNNEKDGTGRQESSAAAVPTASSQPNSDVTNVASTDTGVSRQASAAVVVQKDSTFMPGQPERPLDQNYPRPGEPLSFVSSSNTPRVLGSQANQLLQAHFANSVAGNASPTRNDVSTSRKGSSGQPSDGLVLRLTKQGPSTPGHQLMNPEQDARQPSTLTPQSNNRLNAVTPDTPPNPISTPGPAPQSQPSQPAETFFIVRNAVGTKLPNLPGTSSGMQQRVSAPPSQVPVLFLTESQQKLLLGRILPQVPQREPVTRSQPMTVIGGKAVVPLTPGHPVGRNSSSFLPSGKQKLQQSATGASSSQAPSHVTRNTPNPSSGAASPNQNVQAYWFKDKNGKPMLLVPIKTVQEDPGKPRTVAQQIEARKNSAAPVISGSFPKKNTIPALLRRRKAAATASQNMVRGGPVLLPPGALPGNTTPERPDPPTVAQQIEKTSAKPATLVKLPLPRQHSPPLPLTIVQKVRPLCQLAGTAVARERQSVQPETMHKESHFLPSFHKHNPNKSFHLLVDILSSIPWSHSRKQLMRVVYNMAATMRPQGTVNVYGFMIRRLRFKKHVQASKCINVSSSVAKNCTRKLRIIGLFESTFLIGIGSASDPLPGGLTTALQGRMESGKRDAEKAKNSHQGGTSGWRRIPAFIDLTNEGPAPLIDLTEEKDAAEKEGTVNQVKGTDFTGYEEPGTRVMGSSTATTEKVPPGSTTKKDAFDAFKVPETNSVPRARSKEANKNQSISAVDSGRLGPEVVTLKESCRTSQAVLPGYRPVSSEVGGTVSEPSSGGSSADLVPDKSGSKKSEEVTVEQAERPSQVSQSQTSADSSKAVQNISGDSEAAEVDSPPSIKESLAHEDGSNTTSEETALTKAVGISQGTLMEGYAESEEVAEGMSGDTEVCDIDGDSPMIVEPGVNLNDHDGGVKGPAQEQTQDMSQRTLPEHCSGSHRSVQVLTEDEKASDTGTNLPTTMEFTERRDPCAVQQSRSEVLESAPPSGSPKPASLDLLLAKDQKEAVKDFSETTAKEESIASDKSNMSSVESEPKCTDGAIECDGADSFSGTPFQPLEKTRDSRIINVDDQPGMDADSKMIPKSDMVGGGSVAEKDGSKPVYDTGGDYSSDAIARERICKEIITSMVEQAVRSGEITPQSDEQEPTVRGEDMVTSNDRRTEGHLTGSTKLDDRPEELEAATVDPSNTDKSGQTADAGGRDEPGSEQMDIGGGEDHRRQDSPSSGSISAEETPRLSQTSGRDHKTERAVDETEAGRRDASAAGKMDVGGGKEGKKQESPSSGPIGDEGTPGGTPASSGTQESKLSVGGTEANVEHNRQETTIRNDASEPSTTEFSPGKTGGKLSMEWKEGAVGSPMKETTACGAIGGKAESTDESGPSDADAHLEEASDRTFPSAGKTDGSLSIDKKEETEDPMMPKASVRGTVGEKAATENGSPSGRNADDSLSIGEKEGRENPEMPTLCDAVSGKAVTGDGSTDQPPLEETEGRESPSVGKEVEKSGEDGSSAAGRIPPNVPSCGLSGIKDTGVDGGKQAAVGTQSEDVETKTADEGVCSGGTSDLGTGTGNEPTSQKGTEKSGGAGEDDSDNLHKLVDNLSNRVSEVVEAGVASKDLEVAKDGTKDGNDEEDDASSTVSSTDNSSDIESDLEEEPEVIPERRPWFEGATTCSIRLRTLIEAIYDGKAPFEASWPPGYVRKAESAEVTTGARLFRDSFLSGSISGREMSWPLRAKKRDIKFMSPTSLSSLLEKGEQQWQEEKLKAKKLAAAAKPAFRDLPPSQRLPKRDKVKSLEYCVVDKSQGEEQVSEGDDIDILGYVDEDDDYGSSDDETIYTTSSFEDEQLTRLESLFELGRMPTFDTANEKYGREREGDGEGRDGRRRGRRLSQKETTEKCMEYVSAVRSQLYLKDKDFGKCDSDSEIDIEKLADSDRSETNSPLLSVKDIYTAMNRDSYGVAPESMSGNSSLSSSPTAGSRKRKADVLTPRKAAAGDEEQFVSLFVKHPSDDEGELDARSQARRTKIHILKERERRADQRKQFLRLAEAVCPVQPELQPKVAILQRGIEAITNLRVKSKLLKEKLAGERYLNYTRRKRIREVLKQHPHLSELLLKEANSASQPRHETGTLSGGMVLKEVAAPSTVKVGETGVRNLIPEASHPPLEDVTQAAQQLISAMKVVMSRRGPSDGNNICNWTIESLLDSGPEKLPGYLRDREVLRRPPVQLKNDPLTPRQRMLLEKAERWRRKKHTVIANLPLLEEEGGVVDSSQQNSEEESERDSSDVGDAQEEGQDPITPSKLPPPPVDTASKDMSAASEAKPAGSGDEGEEKWESSSSADSSDSSLFFVEHPGGKLEVYYPKKVGKKKKSSNKRKREEKSSNRKKQSGEKNGNESDQSLTELSKFLLATATDSENDSNLENSKKKRKKKAKSSYEVDFEESPWLLNLKNPAKQSLKDQTEGHGEREAKRPKKKKRKKKRKRFSDELKELIPPIGDDDLDLSLKKQAVKDTAPSESVRKTNASKKGAGKPVPHGRGLEDASGQLPFEDMSTVDSGEEGDGWMVDDEDRADVGWNQGESEEEEDLGSIVLGADGKVITGEGGENTEASGVGRSQEEVDQPGHIVRQEPDKEAKPIGIALANTDAWTQEVRGEETVLMGEQEGPKIIMEGVGPEVKTGASQEEADSPKENVEGLLEKAGTSEDVEGSQEKAGESSKEKTEVIEDINVDIKKIIPCLQVEEKADGTLDVVLQGEYSDERLDELFALPGVMEYLKKAAALKKGGKSQPTAAPR